jgi:Ca2+-binding RTX toxin-like protein
VVVDVRLTAVVDDVVELALDPVAPGRGPTDYPTEAPADIPKAYAMIVKAAALDGGHTAALQALAQTSDEWLRAHDDEDGDGVTGWGLPFAWDAFGDGTPNPDNTEYAITTAIVIDALLDRANTLSGPERAETLELAWQAISPYLDPALATPGGLAPYSLTPQDGGWDVFNTAAYLAAMAQRLSSADIASERITQLQAFADNAMQVLLDTHLVAPDGAWYWPYLTPGSTVNDLPHASYIIYSIESYAHEGGVLANEFQREAIWRHLGDFVDMDGGYIRSYPDFVDSDGPARSYDVGFALATVSLFGDSAQDDIREQLIEVLSTYRLPDGHYAKYPVTGPAATTDPLVVTEYETYFLFGATAGLADELTKRFVLGEDVALAGNEEANVLTGNAGNNLLATFEGNDVATANAGDDVLAGGDGSDTLNGGDGNDKLYAGSGLWTDVLVGAAGDDIYELYNVASQIYENAGEGWDTVRSYAWVTVLWDNVEDLQLIDPSSNTDGIGNALGNILRGNIGSNHLNGLDGNDILIGNAGNDTMDGGNGTDTINGGDGNDTLYAGSGLWTDVLVGAAGDDIYELYNVASQIYENAGEGTDTLRSYAWATTLPGNVENLVLIDPSSNTDGTGNALANTLTGNIGNNRLSGLDGADTLTGDRGADTVTGGTGADTFVLRAGDGGYTLALADVITDYQDGTDSIGLGGGLTYAGLTIQQGTGPNANHTIIQHGATGEYLAVLQTVNSSALDALDFKTISG